MNDSLSSTQEENYLNTSEVDWEKTSLEDSFGAAHVAGYLLPKVNVPIADYRQCTNSCFLTDQSITPSHLYTQFKEYNDNNFKINYVSKRILQLCSYIHHIVYEYLDNKGHAILIEGKIKKFYNCMKIL